MEKKDFNLAYIYLMAIFAIGITMANIISFFGGVGFAFVGASVLLILFARKVLNSAYKKRFGDILILVIIEFLMFIILFFAYDFNMNGITNKSPMVMRNICAIYSIIALGYVAFRYFSEIKGKRYKFVEYILGNYTPEKKEKKAKPTKEMIKKNRELENGTLEPKPITMQSSAQVRPQQHIPQQNVNVVRPQQTYGGNVQNVQPDIAGSSTENSQPSQPQNNQGQQPTQEANNEQKSNVMEAIKNHPNYRE